MMSASHKKQLAQVMKHQASSISISISIKKHDTSMNGKRNVGKIDMNL